MRKKNIKIVAGTGHRAQFLPCGYLDNDSDWANSIKKNLAEWLQKNKPSKIISGGATGWDTWLAEVALELGFKVNLYLPFANMGNSWVGGSKERLDFIRTHKNTTVKIIQKEWTPDCYFKRDKAMVDDADFILALYSGKGTGGTYYTLEYAKNKKVNYLNFWNDPDKNNS